MFLDASAICAMITSEDDAETLGRKLRAAETRLTSPLAIWESVTNVSRIFAIEHREGQRLVESYLVEMGISVISVEPDMTALALEAFRRFGKGRHPAALNFGDCFAYACARHHRMPLLFKGNDFSRTDIDAA